MTFNYQPSTFPDPKQDPDGFLSKVKDEFDHIMRAVNGQSNSIQLREFTAEPSKKLIGMMVLADGSHWDPGKGGGVYCWDVVPPAVTPGWQYLGNVESAFTGRPLLIGNTTYYVDVTSGDDANDGLSSAKAFKTIAKAISTLYQIDLNSYTATIQLADGTYNENPVFDKPFTGSGRVFLVGNATTPTNVVVGSATGNGVTVQNRAFVYLQNFQVRSGSLGNSLLAIEGGFAFYSGLDFAAAINYHIYVRDGGTAFANGDYTISGGANSHALSQIGGRFYLASRTVTLVGTPAFSAFISLSVQGLAFMNGNTYVGSATGPQYSVTSGSLLYKGGASLPGNSAGYANGGFVDSRFYASEQEAFDFTVEDPDNIVYPIEISAPYGYTITRIDSQCRAGSCVATFKIGSTALGGGANSVSTTLQTKNHSSANVVATGNATSVTISSNSSCTGARFTIWYTRT